MIRKTKEISAETWTALDKEIAECTGDGWVIHKVTPVNKGATVTFEKFDAPATVEERLAYLEQCVAALHFLVTKPKDVVAPSLAEQALRQNMPARKGLIQENKLSMHEYHSKKI